MRVRIAASAAPSVHRRKNQMRNAAASRDRQPAQHHRENKNQHGTKGEIRNREAEEREDTARRDRFAVPRYSAPPRHSGGNSDQPRIPERHDRQFQRCRIVRQITLETGC